MVKKKTPSPTSKASTTKASPSPSPARTPPSEIISDSSIDVTIKKTGDDDESDESDESDSDDSATDDSKDAASGSFASGGDKVQPSEKPASKDTSSASSITPASALAVIVTYMAGQLLL